MRGEGEASGKSKPVWLVTGGAGYIGAHVVRALVQRGLTVVVLDSLELGKRARLPVGVEFVEGRVQDVADLGALASGCEFDGIVHLAGYKNARESTGAPLKYWENNVAALITLAGWAVDTGVRNFVFSSSSSVYGHQSGVDESSPIMPVSPYGETKAAGERILRAVSSTTELTLCVLRYFNVIGCGDFDQAHDTGIDNVVPRFVDAARAGRPMEIYGDSHATADGTCARDYVDVRDLAEAHALIAWRMSVDRPVPEVVNVGTGVPTSVLEIAQHVRAAVGRPSAPVSVRPAHPADPAEVWAQKSPLLTELGWAPACSIGESIGAHAASSAAAERTAS